MASYKGYPIGSVTLRSANPIVIVYSVPEGWVIEDTTGHELNLRGQWVGTGARFPTLDEAIAAWERLKDECG